MSVPKDQTAHKHKKSYLKSPYVRSGRSSCNTILVEQVLSPLSHPLCIHSGLKKSMPILCVALPIGSMYCFVKHLSKAYTSYYFALSKLPFWLGIFTEWLDGRTSNCVQIFLIHVLFMECGYSLVGLNWCILPSCKTVMQNIPANCNFYVFNWRDDLIS